LQKLTGDDPLSLKALDILDNGGTEEDLLKLEINES
jgi:hypothetical protein